MFLFFKASMVFILTNKKACSFKRAILLSEINTKKRLPVTESYTNIIGHKIPDLFLKIELGLYEPYRYCEVQEFSYIREASIFLNP